ncbi:hypothetical protein Prudu_002843 [Prunus dulcis]|uniref:Uncharacterized protein n=1 Tax=Prunus dulcis TaxID=3755 RepID=A0A4Y1QRN1_PRUDU|nr:hypothetical protein Prudu_002843 [Prunus dulcis]
MAVGRVFVPNKTLVSSPKFPTSCFPLQVPNKQEGVLSSPSWSCASTNYKEASRKTTNKEDQSFW